MFQYYIYITIMHLPNAFIQTDLQGIQSILSLSVCVFPGNWTHNRFALLMQCYNTEPQEHFNIDWSP